MQVVFQVKKIFYWNFNNLFSRVCKIFIEFFFNFMFLLYIKNYVWYVFILLRLKIIICQNYYEGQFGYEVGEYFN